MYNSSEHTSNYILHKTEAERNVSSKMMSMLRNNGISIIFSVTFIHLANIFIKGNRINVGCRKIKVGDIHN